MTVNVTDPVDLARALIQCRSVTPDEGGALTLLQSVLEPLGFVCDRRICVLRDIRTWCRLGISVPGPAIRSAR